jgi:hypothetical protein
MIISMFCSLSPWDPGIALGDSNVPLPHLIVNLPDIDSLAYAEMRLVLAQILWNFDMELLEKSKSWTEHLSYVLWDKPPLYVHLTPRIPVAK